MSEKACSRCGETKPLELFSRQKLGPYGHRAECKDCQRVYNSAWKAANRDRTRATNRAHYEANREATLAYNRAWNVANRDRTRAALRRYRAAHPERLAMAKALRRKLGASRQSAELALQRVALYGGRCYYCRARSTIASPSAAEARISRQTSFRLAVPATRGSGHAQSESGGR